MNAAPTPHEHDRSQPHLRAGIFLFRDAGAAAITQAILAFGAVAQPYAVPAPSPFWVYPAVAESMLQLHVIHDIADYEIDLTAGTYLSWWLPLKAALGSDPASALQIQLAEGEAGARMIPRLATLLLEQHAGIVQDDNSAHAWTLDELRAEAVFDGYRFFQPRRLTNSDVRDN